MSFLAVMAGGLTYGQDLGDTVYLSNPSFEDYPRAGRQPMGWYDCGFPNETPPDVQPDPTFSVNKPAIHGNTYLGMVVRDNETWESVSQRLSRPLKKGKCYSFSIYLSRSDEYYSQSRITNEPANYVTPAKIRIYGGYGYCDKSYMLAESNLITNTRWILHEFRFEPIGDYSYITIEAYYQTPTLFPYNGNVLLDKASSIDPIPCEEQVAKNDPPPPPKVDPTPPKPKNTTPVKKQDQKSPPDAVKPEEPKVAVATPKPKTPVADEEVFQGVKRSQLKEGTIISIDKLYFEANKAIIKKESFPKLEEVYQFLNSNDDLVVEIGGHTNGLAGPSFADELSTERAKAVADFLVKKGIDDSRLQFKGYGRNVPIADNGTIEGRRKNQRVEIKILGFRRG